MSACGLPVVVEESGFGNNGYISLVVFVIRWLSVCVRFNCINGVKLDIILSRNDFIRKSLTGSYFAIMLDSVQTFVGQEHLLVPIG
jgi:hypothetical protein